MFTSSTNREIRKFHVVVVQRGQRNVQKKRDPRGFSGARGARDGAVVRALASQQCGPGSNPGVDAICGLSLLLVPSLAPRGFSLGTPVFPSPQKPALPNSNSTRNQVETKNHFVDVLPPNHYLLFMHVQNYCFANPIQFLCRSRCCRRCSVLLVEPPSSRLNKMSHSESLSSVDSDDSEWNFIPGVAPNIRAKRPRRS